VLPSDTTTTSAAATSAAPAVSGTPADQIRAAVRHYYATAQKASTTGSVAELTELSLKTCGCRRLATHISAQPGLARSLTIQVLSVSLHEVTATSGFATVHWRESPHVLVDSAGNVVKRFDRPGEARDEMRFTLVANRWLVAEVTGLR
jgi:hypothetical protein